MEKTTVKSNFKFNKVNLAKLKKLLITLDLKHLELNEYNLRDVFASKILKSEIENQIKEFEKNPAMRNSKPSPCDYTEGLEYKLHKDIYPCKLLENAGIYCSEEYFENMDNFDTAYEKWVVEEYPEIFGYQDEQNQSADLSNNNQQTVQNDNPQQSKQQNQPAPLYNNTNHQQQAAVQPFSNGAGQQMNNSSAPIYNNAINLINSIFSNPLMKKDFMDLISKYVTVPAQQQQFINIGHGQCTVPMRDVLNANLYSGQQPQYQQEQIPEEPVPNQEEQNPPIVTEEQQTVPNQERQQMATEEPLEAVTLFPEVEAETFSLSNKEIEENAQNFKKIYSNYNSISKDARNGVKAPLAAFCRLLEAEKEKGVDTDSYNFKIMNPKKLSEDQIIFKDFNNHITGMVIKNPDGSYLPTITPDNVPV